MKFLKTVRRLGINVGEGLKICVMRTESNVDGEQAVQKVRATKHDEALIVARTYTVVEPWAVMVKSFHTFVARTAVLGTCVYLFLTQRTSED